MATVTAVPALDEKIMTWVWTGIVTADTATAIVVSHTPSDIMEYTSGTFAGGTSVTWEGSIDGTNFVALVDPANTAIAHTAAGGSAIRDAWKWIRPVVASGAADSITATLMARVI